VKQQSRLQPGDHVFWTRSNRTVAGEDGLFIGYTSDEPEMAVVEIDGHPVFMPTRDILFMGTTEARRGASARRRFMTANPGVLKP